MINKPTNKHVLFKNWQSSRINHLVIMSTFLFFYTLGTVQSYSLLSFPPMFNLPVFLPISAVFLCAYIIYCLVTKKDRQSFFLLPVITLFTTLFITINSHFVTETSNNSFLYFTLLLPLFYSHILSYNFQLLVANNLIIFLSYIFAAVIGETSLQVVMINTVFLGALVFLTLYPHIKPDNYKRSAIRPRHDAFNNHNSLYLKTIIHDIRQPLSSLALYTHLLEKQSEDAKHAILIKNLLASSNQLDRWLSSLLELTVLDSKNRLPVIKNVPLETCLSDVIEKYTQIARQKSMRLKVKFVKTVVYSDSKLLAEIIDNLLSNAFIHGHQEADTKVLLSARHHQENAIIIQVWNKGPRIQNDQLDSLFNELYYSKNIKHNKAKGLGLGLALSQRKAKLLNTIIKVKTSDNGCCFSIKITKGLASHPLPFLAPEKNHKKQSIILIDDDTSILSALSMLLENWGYDVSCAENSTQAIKLIESQRFSLIISDYRLPSGKNGIELIKLAQQKQNIPAILLTGEVDPDKLQEIPPTHYKILNKPIKPAPLRILIRQLLTKHTV